MMLPKIPTRLSTCREGFCCQLRDIISTGAWTLLQEIELTRDKPNRVACWEKNTPTISLEKDELHREPQIRIERLKKVYALSSG